jgi:hypothetical protein
MMSLASFSLKNSFLQIWSNNYNGLVQVAGWTYLSSPEHLHYDVNVLFIFGYSENFHDVGVVNKLHYFDFILHRDQVALAQLSPGISVITALTYFEMILIATRSPVALCLPFLTVAKDPLHARKI